MINSNEQALLTFLEEQRQQTQSQLIKEVETHNYWASGEYKKNDVWQNHTNDTIDFFISNYEKRIQPLKVRLKWLESEIDNFNFNEDISEMEKSTLTFNGVTFDFIQRKVNDVYMDSNYNPIESYVLDIYINGKKVKISEVKTHLPNTIEECLEYIQYFEL